MEQANMLIVAMAEQCRDVIQRSDKTVGLPAELQPKHLLWMCDKIQRHAEGWPATKLHRWIGFVQAGMIANQMLDLKGAKSMFDNAKSDYGVVSEDQDLIDHLDSSSSFEIELGGQG